MGARGDAEGEPEGARGVGDGEPPLGVGEAPSVGCGDAVAGAEGEGGGVAVGEGVGSPPLLVGVFERESASRGEGEPLPEGEGAAAEAVGVGVAPKGVPDGDVPPDALEEGEALPVGEAASRGLPLGPSLLLPAPLPDARSDGEPPPSPPEEGVPVAEGAAPEGDGEVLRLPVSPPVEDGDCEGAGDPVPSAERLPLGVPGCALPVPLSAAVAEGHDDAEGVALAVPKRGVREGVGAGEKEADAPLLGEGAPPVGETVPVCGADADAEALLHAVAVPSAAVGEALWEPVAELQRDGAGEGDGGAVGDAETVPAPAADGDGERVRAAEALPLGVGAPEELALGGREGVTEPVAPSLRTGVMEALLDGSGASEVEGAPENEAAAESEANAECVACVLPVPLPHGELLADELPHGDAEPLPEAGIGEGVAVPFSPLGEGVPVGDTVSLPTAVHEGVPDAVAQGVAERVPAPPPPLAHAVGLGVAHAEGSGSPLRDALGELLALRERRGDSVAPALPVALPPLAEGVPLVEGVAELLPLVAPSVAVGAGGRDWDGVKDCSALVDGVALEEGAPVRDPLEEGLPVGVPPSVED